MSEDAATRTREFYDAWSAAIVPWVRLTETLIREAVSVRSPAIVEATDPQFAADLRALPDIAVNFEAWADGLRVAVLAAGERGLVASDPRASETTRRLGNLMHEVMVYWIDSKRLRSFRGVGFRDADGSLRLSDEIMLHLEQVDNRRETNDLVTDFREFKREFLNAHRRAK